MAIHLTPTLTRATSSGTVAAGALSVAFANASSSVNATVAGGTLKPGESVEFSVGGDLASSARLAAVAYDAGTGGDLVITEVR